MRYFWTKQFTTALMFGCLTSTAFAGNWTVVQTSAGAKYTTDRANWQVITPGMTLPDNSWVNTGKRGRVTIQKDTNVVNINPGTLAGINELGGKLDKTVIAQQTGSVTLDLVHKSAPWMTVQTPFLAAVVKGTKFSVTIGRTEATVDVSRGRVGVTDPRRGETVDIVTGQKAQVDGTSLRPMKVAGAGKIAAVLRVQPTAPVLPMTPDQAQAVQVEQQKASVDPTDENKKIDDPINNDPIDNIENPNNPDNPGNTNNTENPNLRKQGNNETDRQNRDRYQNNHQNDNENNNQNENDKEDKYKKKYQNENQNENKYQKQSYNSEGSPVVQESSAPDIGYSRVPMSGFRNPTKKSKSKTSNKSTYYEKKSSSASSTLSHSTTDNRPVTTLLNTLFGNVVQQSNVVQSPAQASSSASDAPQPQVQSAGDQSNGGSQTPVQTSSNEGNGSSQSQQSSNGEGNGNSQSPQQGSSGEGNSGSQSQTASNENKSETDQTKVSSTSNSGSSSSSSSSSNARVRQLLKKAFPKMRF